MRCERCKFENIPGQKICVKCGSVLEIKTAGINVHPPRMPAWQKPLRNILRRIRRATPQQDTRFHFPPWIKKITGDNFLGLLLSVVPGLAHLIQGRFKEIRWHFLAWLILILSGLFLYGSVIGLVLLGLAIGIHTSIAIQYGIIRYLDSLRLKIAATIFVLIGLIFIYRATPHIVFPNLAGGYANLTISYHNVKAGDYLLARRGLDRKILLPRGSLVLIHPAALTSYESERRRISHSANAVIGEVVGLPGEQLKMDNGNFIINGQQLDTKKYPVPEWLHKIKFSAKIPESSYFVSAAYNVSAHGLRFDGSHIYQVCIVRADDIEAKAFMCWWPLSRRGFIKED